MPLVFLFAGLALVVCVASAVLAELAARAYFRFFAGFAVGWPWTCEILHILPEISSRLPKSARFQCNSLGHRASEPPPPDSQAYRVLIVGASVAECSLLDQSQSWPHLLEGLMAGRLAAAGRATPVHVANLARSSMDSFCVRRIVEETVRQPLQADLMLYAFSYSDVLRWLTNRMPEDVHSLDVHDSLAFAMHPGRKFGWSRQGLAALFLLRILRARFAGKVDHIQQAGRYMLKCRSWRSKGLRVEGLRLPAALVHRAELNIQRIAELCSERRMRLAVLLTPLQDRVFSPEEDALLWLGRIGDGPSSNPDDWRCVPSPELFALLNAMNAQVESICARLGIECISLKGAIAPDFDHFYDEAHMTPLGAAEMAQLVAASLVPTHSAAPRQPH